MARASPTRVYFPELDGLRFVAFLFVFIHHAFPERVFLNDPSEVSYLALLLCRAGGLGVDLFFCLSGFLITTLLLKEREHQGRISVWRFYLRRALRIWPLYFAFIALCNWGLDVYGTALGTHTLPYLLFVGNWSHTLIGFPSSPARILWSVSIEEQFYVAWPVLLSGLRSASIPVASIAMLLIGIGCRIVIALQGAGHPATWCNTFAHLDSLAVGIVLAWWPTTQASTWSRATRVLMFCTGLAAWMMGSHLWPIWSTPTIASAAISYPLYASGAGCMLLSTISSPTARTLPLLRGPTCVFLGRISYGLYVFHDLALTSANSVVTLTLQSVGSHQLEHARWTVVSVGFLGTIALAVSSYYLLERPFLRLKERFAVVPSRPGG